MKEIVKIRRAIGWYSHPPLPTEWGLDNGDFELTTETHSQIIEGANVGPADTIAHNYELIVAGIGVVSAAVSGIFAYLAAKTGGSIKIIGKNGRSIEIPEGTRKDELDYYIAKAKEMDVEDIIVSEYGSPRKDKPKDGI